jgi:hypothetical protein
MKTHYLIDQMYTVDEEHLFGTGGHLLALNPGSRNADLKVTIYYEDRDPDTVSFVAPASRTFETNYRNWDLLKPNVRFALKVESSEPLVCQATTGWNNTMSNFSPHANTLSPNGVRECAKSCTAITRLSNDWYVADGIVIDMPHEMWVRESEWAILLNPGDQDAHVTMILHYDEEVGKHAVQLPAQRVKRLYMDDIARRNHHYGVHFHSDQPVAAQWLRVVKWHDSAEFMTFWSVPCVPELLE